MHPCNDWWLVLNIENEIAWLGYCRSNGSFLRCFYKNVGFLLTNFIQLNWLPHWMSDCVAHYSSLCVLQQDNRGLLNLHLSMNGLGSEGAIGIGNSLKYNKTLLQLDISANRINIEGAIHIAKGKIYHNIISWKIYIQTQWIIEQIMSIASTG